MNKAIPQKIAAFLALGLPLSLPVHAAIYDWNNASGSSTMEGVNWFDTAAPAVNTAITNSGHQINFRGHTSGDIIATFNNSVPAFTSGNPGNIYYVRPEQTDDVSIRSIAGSAQVLRILGRTSFGSNVNFQVGGGTDAELRFEGAGDIDFIGSLIGGQTGTMVRNITTQNTGTVLLGGNNATNDNVSIGTVTISNGTLAVGHNNALGAGTVTIANNARLAADASARTINNTITNTNGAILGQEGAGRLTLAGDWITSDGRLLTVQGEVEVTGALANSATGTNARDLVGGGPLIISSAQNQLDNNRIFLTHGTLRAAHDNAVGSADQLSVDVRNLAGPTNGQSTLELSNNVSINLAEGVRVAGRDLSGPQWTQLRNVDGNNTLGAVILQAGKTDYGIESQAGSLTINGFGGSTGDRDLLVSGAGDVEIETGDFAAVLFNATNTCSGTTTVNNDSRLSITGNGTFGDGTGDVILNGGLLGIYCDMTVDNTITGASGDVAIHNNSTVLFSAEPVSNPHKSSK